MELPERRILLNALFKAQFSYCPVFWMFRSLSLNNKINRFHERYLRIIYNDKHSSFEETLVKDSSASVQRNNIYILATGTYKVVNGLSPNTMMFLSKGIGHLII